MKYTNPRLILLFLVFLSISLPITQAKDSAVIVFDASGSMWGQIKGKAKIEIARGVMGTLVKDWNEDIELGLMAYGHRKKGDCNDIEMLQPVSTVNANKMLKLINKIVPKGKTPISQSLRQAAETLRYTEDPATVILISDGEETCNADPCVVSKELEAKGINFTTHVIGFDIKKNKKALKQLKCIAKNTGGEFYQAEDAVSLKKALIKVKKAVVDPRPALCKTYAKNAVKQEKTNIEKECSFEGEFWTTDYATHFDWCMAQGIESEVSDKKYKTRQTDLKKCKSRKINKSLSKGIGTLTFKWSSNDFWTIYRGNTKIKQHLGSATQTLQSGAYTIKSKKPVFEPIEVIIEKGKKTIINNVGMLNFKWSSNDFWTIYRGTTKVAQHLGSATQALQPGTYTIKPKKPVFEPMEITIEKGKKTVIDNVGILTFKWSSNDFWTIYRGTTKVAQHLGSATQALQPGAYTIKPKKPVFEPMEVIIKAGENTVIN